MTEYLPDLSERGTAPRHRSGQAVAEQVRAARRWRESGPDERARHNRGDGGGMGEAAVRCPVAEEDASRSAGWAVLSQIEGERLPDVAEQGEAVADQALAVDDDLPFAPAQIVELERYDLARAKAQPGEQ